ncbi:hypothetical protein F0L68_06030 [Solihabitans fulvus]|uniref:Uncharacterized protein n=1 Tax=Solihabitans fulvus TaxID=1892852 RepID=A0A5B2XP76_9PSEU|nr:hypothetical protein [Solihabitans fulvus]KAA2264652.1 hypothetical protein F0L68_06030 [Solihabitans fulvus]
MADRNVEGRPRGLDVFTMIAGIVTLMVSAYVITDGAVSLPMANPKWLIAGGATLVGILFLASSLRRRK